MLKDMFGNFSSGRIGRLRFIGLTILLEIIFVATGLATGVFAGVLENIYPQETLRAATPALGFAAFAIMLAVGIAMMVGTLNLAAKRTRDIGWPPVLLVILYIFFSLVVWLVLAIVPGRAARDEAAALADVF